MKRFVPALLSLFAANVWAQSHFTPADLSGQTFIHDPSSIMKVDGRYYVYGTRPGIISKSSTNLVTWENEAPIFRQPPAWTLKVAPGFDGHFWAPDVIRVSGKYFLYYSVSAFGKQTSAIGLAVNATLNSSATNFLWQDMGEVIRSTNGSLFNTIDPSLFKDRDGKLWMAFGSYWKGIFLTELDPRTGKQADTNTAPQQLAWNHSIEAACLTRHDKYYYLLVNWGQCCKGTNSTYEVRVGRSEKISGPYRDRDGNDLSTGGGSPFLETTGRFIGPGHIGILDDGNTNGMTTFSYHYYDADSRGRSRLAIAKIDWSTGWPIAVR